MKLITSYTPKKSNGLDCSFIGMNTGNGFAGKYADIINERELIRLYIIKGAPGTGKSTLMKTCGEYARKAGYDVKYYLCSSDANSVDCVVIEGKIILLDGTSPHALEMKYPGAVSHIFDTTAFWNNSVLEDRRDEIISLTDAKKRAFDSAYSYLSAVSKLERELFTTASGFIMLDKLAAFAERFTRTLPRSNGRGILHEDVLCGIGMHGKVGLDTFEARSKHVVEINDEYFSSYIMTNMLTQHLLSRGYSLTVSRDPVSARFIRSIFIDECAVLITVDSAEEVGRTLNMSRFVDRERLGMFRGEMRLAGKCVDELFSGALDMLSSAGDYHFKLENIYSSAVDFARLDMATESLKDDISRCLSEKCC